ncbi:transcriptional regulator, MerR family [Roseobacter sp. GAI101]|nr:MerR family transcriptional regulator [Roseobacter sp. GAI101]EEB83215.1 transcriptional regulator, MerR family [Roseobacter sp. GAI101]
MAKSADAFRTISEVADWLEIQAHVLRFWESKFTQVKPIKRAGGRRYYRPADMLLLGGIKRLLHDDGLTIKGVQKILREEGMSHVAALSAPLDEVTQADLNQNDQDMIDMPASAAKVTTVDVKEPVAESVVLPFEASRADKVSENTQPDMTAKDQSTLTEPEIEETADPDQDVLPSPPPQTIATPPVEAEDRLAAPPQAIDEPTAPADTEAAETSNADTLAPETQTPPASDSSKTAPTTEADNAKADIAPDAATQEPEPVQQIASPEPDQDTSDTATDTPKFLRRPAPEQISATHNTTPAPKQEPPAAAPKPRVIDLPPIPSEADMSPAPTGLASMLTCKRVSPDSARKIAPVLARLQAMHDSMPADHSPSAKD